MKRLSPTLCLLILVVVSVSGTGLAEGIDYEHLDDFIPYPEDPRVVLLIDNFKDQPIGSTPMAWRTNGGPEHISVVEIPELDSGRGVRIKSNPAVGDTWMRARLSDPPAGSAQTIVIEHQVKYSEHRNNTYITKDNSHRLHWWIANGILHFNERADSSIKAYAVAGLQEGWNRIRLVADLNRQQVVIFVNDMSIPASKPLTFGRPIDSWAGAEMIIAQHVSSPEEFHYGDIRIWALESFDVDGLMTVADEGSTPIWMDFQGVDHRPEAWWASVEARQMAHRITQRIDRGGPIYFDIPVTGVLTVADGIFSTQLKVLAHVYAATGDPRFKDAFARGIQRLYEAQFPSGTWPRTYPDDRRFDLIKDKFANESWTSIPTVISAIIDGRKPFHTDITDGIDLSLLEQVRQRIPDRNHFHWFGFQYAPYAAMSDAWWSSDEAIRIGDNLISWQYDNGGWGRVLGMAHMPFSPELGHTLRGNVYADGIERGDFLGGRITNPMRYLARLYAATGEDRFLTAFYRGLDFILEAQYSTGGWPRAYPMLGMSPESNPFYNAVTFYYDGMTMVLEFIQELLDERYPFTFVDDAYRERLERAFTEGIEFILAAQIEVDGRLTAWAQRHHPFTHEPVPGRVFEPVAINPWVSVGIIELLRSIENPSAQVRTSILSALEYLENVRLADGRWAMFYEIGTNRPIFLGRDGIVRYEYSEIDLERQQNYAWFGTWPEGLFAQIKRSGYMESLHESLPDHPSVRVRFINPKEGGRVSGSLPIHVELMHPHHEERLEKVEIDLDGRVVYQGLRLPSPDELIVATEMFEDGRRTLTVTTVHEDFGTYRQSVEVNLSNRWTLIQNMNPPVTQGWFGTVDFLQTSSRSDGWTYDTGRSGEFFGDPQRLVRQADSSEFLVWKTSRLQSAWVTLFVRPETPLENGLQLSVSTKGGDWKSVDYHVTVEDRGGEWHRITVVANFTDDSPWNWFRLDLTDALSHESVQIGEVVMTGFHETN